MFLDNLAAAVLRLCDEYNLTYEAASERCHLSSRYFADIVRGKTAPSILTLEKLCKGLDRTPNELLIKPVESKEPSYIECMQVTQIFRLKDGEAERTDSLPACPHCVMSPDREYQSYCTRCGQCLGRPDTEDENPQPKG